MELDYIVDLKAGIFTMEIFRLALEKEEDINNDMYTAVKAKGTIDGTSDWDDDYPNREILKDDLLKRCVYVLERSGTITAAISIVDEKIDELESLDWKEVKSCFLVRLCVGPEYQGQGIGEKMMHHVNDHARRSGYGATHHLAAKENKAAIRLYERMGYRNLGAIHVFGKDFVAYEMAL